MTVLLPASALAKSDRDCQRPKPPEIPDGKTASQIDMISTKQRLKLYMDSGNLFLDCLDEAGATVGSVARDRVLKRIETKRTEITEEMQRVTNEFNAQVRLFNSSTTDDGDASPDGDASAGAGAADDGPRDAASGGEQPGTDAAPVAPPVPIQLPTSP